MTNSIPERLRSAQAAIEAATARYLQQGGTIAQVDSYGRPIEHLSWKDEAERAKAAGLSYISEHKSEKPKKQARKPLALEQDKARQKADARPRGQRLLGRPGATHSRPRAG